MPEQTSVFWNNVLPSSSTKFFDHASCKQEPKRSPFPLGWIFWPWISCRSQKTQSCSTRLSHPVWTPESFWVGPGPDCQTAQQNILIDFRVATVMLLDIILTFFNSKLISVGIPKLHHQHGLYGSWLSHTIAKACRVRTCVPWSCQHGSY